MKICAVRHLPTTMNRAGLLQGRCDEEIAEPDSEIKEAIARNRHRILSLGPFDHVLVSTLRRTRQTASWYGFDRPEEEPLLDELDFGPFEGRPKADMIRELGPAWMHQPGTLVLGEPVATMEERIRNFLRQYGRSPAVLLFGHGSWIRGLVSLVRQGNVGAMNTFSLENNSLTVLAVSNSIRERLWAA